MAALIANAVCRYYVIFDLERQISNLKSIYGRNYPEIVALKDEITSIKNAKGDLQDLTAIGFGSVKIIEPAANPIKPFRPKKKLIILLSAIFGLLMGICIVLLTEGLSSTFKNPWEFEIMSKIKVISSVPTAGGVELEQQIIKDVKSSDPVALAFRKIAEQIYLVLREKRLKTIAFADINNPRAAALNAYNIGYMAANLLNLKVLVVGADLRHAPLAKIIGINQGKGLCDFLSGKCELEKCLVKVCDNLSVIPEGKAEHGSLTLIAGENFSKAITEFQNRFEMVLINTSCLAEHTDSIYVAKMADIAVISLGEG